MAKPIPATPHVRGDDAKRILERLQPDRPIDEAEVERRTERVRQSLEAFRTLKPRPTGF